MKKICPYCGRIGDLGTSCNGCGYVLLEKDKDVPSDPPASPSIGKQAEPEENQPPNTTVRHAAATDQRTSTSPPPRAQKPVAAPISGKKTVVSGFFGILILIYGMLLFFNAFKFYFTNDILNGFISTTLGLSVIAGGLLCIRPVRIRYKKCLKYILVIGLLLTFGIPLALFLPELL